MFEACRRRMHLLAATQPLEARPLAVGQLDGELLGQALLSDETVDLVEHLPMLDARGVERRDDAARRADDVCPRTGSNVQSEAV